MDSRTLAEYLDAPRHGNSSLTWAEYQEEYEGMLSDPYTFTHGPQLAITSTIKPGIQTAERELTSSTSPTPTSVVGPPELATWAKDEADRILGGVPVPLNGYMGMGIWSQDCLDNVNFDLLPHSTTAPMPMETSPAVEPQAEPSGELSNDTLAKDDWKGSNYPSEAATNETMSQDAWRSSNRTERRRVQNRLSQRSFREKQRKQIEEMKSTVVEQQQEIDRLEAENRRLEELVCNLEAQMSSQYDS